MIKYPKIQSIFKRSDITHKFIEGNWSLPELEYLQNNLWLFTEKVDGMNIRVEWRIDTEAVEYNGRTDKAQVPFEMYKKLLEVLPLDKFKKVYPNEPMVLFGEGYGAKIQKGGGNYKSDGVDFVLFDVWIDGWWLEQGDVNDIARGLGIESVPYRGIGTIYDAVKLVKNGLKSEWGNFEAEGLVIKPLTQLFDRRSNRIIAKLKHKDFRKEV